MPRAQRPQSNKLSRYYEDLQVRKKERLQDRSLVYIIASAHVLCTLIIRAVSPSDYGGSFVRTQRGGQSLSSSGVLNRNRRCLAIAGTILARLAGNQILMGGHETDMTDVEFIILLRDSLINGPDDQIRAMLRVPQALGKY